MKTKHYLPAALCLLLLAACAGKDYTQQAPPPRRDSIDIAEVQVALPEADGKELVEASCVPCHSLRYIEMQPALTEKSWEKTVTKMIKNYGAPVKDSIAAGKIVKYLVAIKGVRH